jgi:biotin carboxyl carrier protein
MSLRKMLLGVGLALVLVAVPIVGMLTFDIWTGWLYPKPEANEPAPDEHGHAHGEDSRIRLSPQARANLRLVVKPVVLGDAWRTIDIPGTVVERPDQSELGVSTPLAGVITQISAVPGDSVRPGDELFTVRIISEALQAGQAQLYKTVRDVEINDREQKRLRDQPRGPEVFQARLTELGYERERLVAALDVARQDLLARGLNAEQVDDVAKGRFLREIRVSVASPRRTGPSRPAEIATVGGGAVQASDRSVSDPVYTVEEIKVKVGEQVQAGQMLAGVANHQALYIEGRGFEEDTSLLERTLHNSWPLSVEFVEDLVTSWPEFQQEWRIQYLGAKLDPTTRTFPFYIPLMNQFRERAGPGGRVNRFWRYRPGQRVQIGVPVERFKEVIVLSIEAVAREGSETYVFRANGDVFDRKPVHVVHEDSRRAIIANDGSITVGNLVAQNGAAQLQRALKAKAGGEGGGHDHHGHSHEE